jgi:hypothetical protein
MKTLYVMPKIQQNMLCFNFFTAFYHFSVLTLKQTLLSVEMTLAGALFLYCNKCRNDLQFLLCTLILVGSF